MNGNNVNSTSCIRQGAPLLQQNMTYQQQQQQQQIQAQTQTQTGTGVGEGEEDKPFLDIQPIAIQPTFFNVGNAFSAMSSTASSSSSSSAPSTSFSVFASPTMIYAAPILPTFQQQQHQHQQQQQHETSGLVMSSTAAPSIASTNAFAQVPAATTATTATTTTTTTTATTNATCFCKRLCFSSPNNTNFFGAQFSTAPQPTVSIAPGVHRQSGQSSVEEGANRLICNNNNNNNNGNDRPQMTYPIPASGGCCCCCCGTNASGTSTGTMEILGASGDYHLFHDSQRSFTTPLFDDAVDATSDYNDDVCGSLGNTMKRSQPSQHHHHHRHTTTTTTTTTATTTTTTTTSATTNSHTRHRDTEMVGSSGSFKSSGSSGNISDDDENSDDSEDDYEEDDDEEDINCTRERSRSRSPQGRSGKGGYDFREMGKALGGFSIMSTNSNNSSIHRRVCGPNSNNINNNNSSNSSGGSGGSGGSSSSSSRGRDLLDFKYRERVDGDGNTRLIIGVNTGNFRTINDCLKRKNCFLFINDKNYKGETALYRACVKHSCVIAEMLLDKGADPDIPTMESISPLHAAVAASASTSSIRIIEALIKHGADATARDEVGDTPLHWAIREKSDPAVKTLVNEAGAHIIGCKNEDDETPLDFAEEFGEGDTYEWLKAKYDAYLQDLKDD